MIVYKSYVTFKVLGQSINLISDETAYGLNTVAEVNLRYHYLADEFPGIAAAIYAWQEVNGRDLTNEELHQVMEENNLISGGI